MDFQEELRRHSRSVSLVAAAIISSMVIYLVLVEVLRAVFKPFVGFAAIADIQPIRYVVFGAAIVVIILIRVLRPRLLRETPLEDPKTALHRFQRAALLTLVLGEIPAILGLGLFLVSGNNIDFYILLFASLLLVFMYLPRRGAWKEWSSK